MNCDEIVSGLILEFRRGTLIMVVLAQLKKADVWVFTYKRIRRKGDFNRREYFISATEKTGKSGTFKK